MTLTIVMAGCGAERRGDTRRTESNDLHRLIDESLPPTLKDREGWSTDLFAGLTVLQVAPTRENVCAVVAVIEQESGFRVDPVIPGLPAIAWKEIDERASHAGVPRMVVHSVLGLTSPNGQTYSERVDHAKTEKGLSDIFEDFIGSVPLGRTLFADRNPIRTRGPMQVQVGFAEHQAEVKPYPYPVTLSIADEVFTRRGGVYFGIAHLLDYAAPYDRYVYRFADFNAGQYSSRNAAFQQALTRLSGIPLTPDGALLPHAGEATKIGATELALRAVANRLNLSDSGVHAALEQAKTRDFEKTATYQRVFSAADATAAQPLPRATIPRIDLHGPKITRRLTTEWYANRVQGRFDSCLGR